MKKLIPLLFGCLTVSCLPLRAADQKQEETAVASHMLSEYNLGKVVSNDAVSQDSLKGKVVVLEMWGIHCGPCIASMPGLDALYKRNKDKGFVIVGLHSQDATEEEVQAMVKKLKVKFPITTGGGGPHEGNGIPHSLVFDSAGKLVYEGHPTAPAFEKSVKKALRDVTAPAADSKSSSSSSSASSSIKPSTSPSSKPGALIAERPWTNTDGKIMTAALISVDGDKGTFKKRDGSTFTYAISKLNDEDQATIKEAAAK